MSVALQSVVHCWRRLACQATVNPDAALQGTVLRIFLSVVERCLRDHSPACPATARIGAVAFIHRFGSSLNEHIHFSVGRFA